MNFSKEEFNELCFLIYPQMHREVLIIGAYLNGLNLAFALKSNSGIVLTIIEYCHFEMALTVLSPVGWFNLLRSASIILNNQ